MKFRWALLAARDGRGRTRSRSQMRSRGGLVQDCRSGHFRRRSRRCRRSTSSGRRASSHHAAKASAARLGGRCNQPKGLRVWEDTLRYLYLPRLKDREVLAQAIRTGAASRDFFGTAYNRSGDSYDGFHFGGGGVQLDDTLLLIEPDAAKSFEDSLRQAVQQQPEAVHSGTQETGAGGSISARDEVPASGGGATAQDLASTRPHMFHGTADIAPATAKMRMVEIADEILSVLAGDPNAKLRVTVEISAEFPQGAGDQVKRAVSENARSLGLRVADWE
jgi:hypothetical protein